MADDSDNALSLVARDGATAITPNDAADAYETIDKLTPSEDTFIEAELIAAQGTLTPTANPTDTETVTVGTQDSSTAAVYTFVNTLANAFDVLIGADVTESMENLAAAINGAAGEGSTYGTGTTANADVTAEVQPTDQLIATAIMPGTAGNSIASTETLANGS